ncbi:type II secretion system protein [Aquabacterium sp. OR-4]|uniref:type II secretion system protein n=1 Tax=Aquabacterium sp. OR-4 TaxID=2978127 RepID=UPI0028C75BC3|nr:type II secretion system protein [Aquabacterium sp. OR-4]MDT7836890.1 type II secretion system protein [Aquabacterium sp. OR-4]
MCATSTDRHPTASRHSARPAPRQAAAAVRGFTMVELIATVLLLGVLAAVAMPRLGGTLALGGSAWRDQVSATLKTARSLAQGHRRLVCASVATGQVSLAIAATNPASSCGSTLNGADGSARWASDSANHATTLTPAGTLFFQPDGRITSDGAGLSPLNASIAIAGESAIHLTGRTGHVD